MRRAALSRRASFSCVSAPCAACPHARGGAPDRLHIAFVSTSSSMSIIDISEVKPGSHVTLHYRLSLADGADIVNTFAEKPATLLLGAGQLAPTLEDILVGMKVGHHSTFQLGADEAFGPRNPELLQRVALSTLRENGMMNEALTPGDLIEFNAPGGGRYAGVLKEIGETSALFDFNHPLAGQALTFEVKIIGIL
jgi:FKBP-type peptidyl-prolyl cis-trans isomerase SlpA